MKITFSLSQAIVAYRSYNLFSNALKLAGKTLLFSLPLLLSACSSTASSESKKIEIVEEISLAEQLTETSGLYCDAGLAYTINDSGNSPTLFTMNETGEVTQRQDVAKKNTDWESVTADQDFFYIGDFGNNAGKRPVLSLIKVNRADLGEVQRLDFTYENYDIAKNEYYAHDFDAEAMVARDEHLVVFSKSWLTHKLKIYTVDKSKTNQLLSPQAEVSGIPGVITGADWDEYHQRYILVGYTSNALGMFKPFLALLSEQFALTATYKLEGFGQVEGLCVTGDNAIWLTQESSPFSAAKLFKLKLPE